MFKVRSKYLLLIAAAVWLIAGSQVARMGIEAIAAGNGNLWLLLIGIPAAFVVFHMMFSKLVGKHAARIRSYGEEKMHVLKFFDVRGYLIMAVMMGGGIAPRSFQAQGYRKRRRRATRRALKNAMPIVPKRSTGCDIHGFPGNPRACLPMRERGDAHSAIRIADSLSALPKGRCARYYGTEQYLEGAGRQGSAPAKEASWIRRASSK